MKKKYAIFIIENEEKHHEAIVDLLKHKISYSPIDFWINGFNERFHTNLETVYEGNSPTIEKELIKKIEDEIIAFFETSCDIRGMIIDEELGVKSKGSDFYDYLKGVEGIQEIPKVFFSKERGDKSIILKKIEEEKNSNAIYLSKCNLKSNPSGKGEFKDCNKSGEEIMKHFINISEKRIIGDLPETDEQ